MKLYLLAGGFLITAASVYGITDYMQTKKKKEFKNLYKETPVTLKENIHLPDVELEDFSRGKLETTPLPPPQAKTPPMAKSKKIKLKKAGIKEAEENSIVAVEHIEEIKAPHSIPEVSVPPPPPVEKKKLKKKVNLKMYSRGAIREVTPLPDTASKKE